MNITQIFPRYEQLSFKFEKEVDVAEGLGERQKLVYNTLKQDWKQGATAKELSVHLYQQDLVMSSERNSVHPRLNELIKAGLVKVTGKKTCQYTDKRVSVYATV